MSELRLPQSQKPPKLLNHWPRLLLAFLPALLVVAVFFLVYLPMAANQAANMRANDLAQVRADMLDNNLQQLSQHLDGLARLPRLRLAMRDGDSAVLEKLEDEFMLEFTHLNRLVLFPLGELGVANLGAYKARLNNNIEKDILRRAADNESVLLDAYQLDGRRVFSLARPVYAGDRSIGAILLTLESSWLSAQLDDQRGDGRRVGVTELIYQIGTAAAINIDQGVTSSAADSAAVGEASLQSNEYIKVKYHLFKQQTPLGSAAMILLAVTLLAGVLAVLAVSMVFKAIYHHMEADFKILTTSIEASDESVARFYHPQFASIKKMLDNAELRNANNDGQAKEETTHVVEQKTTLWANPQVAGGMEVEDDVTSHELDQAVAAALPTAQSAAASDVPAHIFRAYDIRGDADTELSDDAVAQIAMAIGTMAIRNGQSQLVVGRDGRLSSPRIHAALVEGLLKTGCDITDIGLVATPMLYFATESLQTHAGVMVTGSHNDANINGFKVVLNGQALAEQQITAIGQLIDSGDFELGSGLASKLNIADSYIDCIADDVVVASAVTVVLDCGNGAASEIAPLLYASLGCDVIPLFAEVDGSFPNHSPDPSVELNLAALVDDVKKYNADLGLAFDGDADRVVAVSSSGAVISADHLLMLFARDVLTRNPGADIVYDIKCSRHLNQVIAGHGGRPVMSKSGHSLIKQKMRETDALLGGELTGHFFFKERWYGFDDGLYSGTRLIELLTLEGVSLDDVVADLPISISTPEIHIPVAESEKFAVIDLLQGAIADEDGELTILDGVRVDYAHGWGLVRASNTSASLNLRFEADDEAALSEIQSRFREALVAINPELGTF